MTKQQHEANTGPAQGAEDQRKENVGPDNRQRDPGGRFKTEFTHTYSPILNSQNKKLELKFECRELQIEHGEPKSVQSLISRLHVFNEARYVSDSEDAVPS